MDILSYEGKLTCDKINCVKVAQGNILKLHTHYSFKVQSFKYTKPSLKEPNTCTYLRKRLHFSNLSKNKKKEKGSSSYMPCYLFFGTCLVSSSTRSLSEKI